MAREGKTRPTGRAPEFTPAPTAGNRALRRELAAEARGKIRPDGRSFRQAMQNAMRERAAEARRTVEAVAKAGEPPQKTVSEVVLGEPAGA